MKVYKGMNSPVPNYLIHPLEKLMQGNSYGITRLLARSQELEKISRSMATVLPESWRPHCRIANVRGHILVLEADSSAWATRLRYHGPIILEHLRINGWSMLLDIHIRVSSPVVLPPIEVRRALISKSTIELLDALARTTTDPEIAAAWGRIVSHQSCKSSY